MGKYLGKRCLPLYPLGHKLVLQPGGYFFGVPFGVRFFILWGVFMAMEAIIYSADCYDEKDNKPYCRYDLLWELSNEAVEFVENSISLAEWKKAVIVVYLSETEIRTEMYFPHGIFLTI